VQLDAAELMGYILNLLPDRMKSRLLVTYQFDVRGREPLLGIPDGVVQVSLAQPYITLDIPPTEVAPTLERLLQLQCDDHTVLPKKSASGVNRNYPTHIRRQFLEAPPVLRFQLNRFWNRQPTLWAQFQNFIGWSTLTGKNEVPVQIPEWITITLANGERRT